MTVALVPLVPTAAPPAAPLTIFPFANTNFGAVDADAVASAPAAGPF